VIHTRFTMTTCYYGHNALDISDYEDWRNGDVLGLRGDWWVDHCFKEDVPEACGFYAFWYDTGYLFDVYNDGRRPSRHGGQF
jgi:hypothetical protein